MRPILYLLDAAPYIYKTGLFYIYVISYKHNPAIYKSRKDDDIRLSFCGTGGGGGGLPSC